MTLIQKRFLMAMASLIALAAVSGFANIRADHHPQPLTVPEQTPLHVTLDQALSSNQSKPGDHFDATISEPVVSGNATVIPEGARVQGTVVDARPSGALRGRARLQLALSSVQIDDKTYDLHTFSSKRVGQDHKKRNWEWIGGGGASGALIGAVAAGGKGALIGGPIGAGGGIALASLTGKKDIHLAPESRLTFELAEPLTLDVHN